MVSMAPLLREATVAPLQPLVVKMGNSSLSSPHWSTGTVVVGVRGVTAGPLLFCQEQNVTTKNCYDMNSLKKFEIPATISKIMFITLCSI